jgi:hypothetical protein
VVEKIKCETEASVVLKIVKIYAGLIISDDGPDPAREPGVAYIIAFIFA